MKYPPHGSVLFCTFSLEEGLLLLANPLCQAIVKTCLARACELYPVRISHIIVEATHIHLVLVVINPDHVEAFFRHFKTDSAHMINGLLGRNKRTVWCEGYDSPIVQSSGTPYVIEAARTPQQMSDMVSAISRDQDLGLHLKSRV